MRGRARALNCRGRKKKETRSKMKGTLVRHLQVQLGQNHLPSSSSSSLSTNPSHFQALLESEAAPESHLPSSSPRNSDLETNTLDDKDFILSQDFFCTPDYITPDNQNLLKGFGCNEENMPCPKSPEKLNTIRNKRCRQDDFSSNPISPSLSGIQEMVDFEDNDCDTNEVKMEKLTATGTKRVQSYVSQSAVALRCRVMPPPCIKNPYIKDSSVMALDPFGNQRSKCADFFPAIVGGNGLSRYHTDFHEIEYIGSGNFSHVFKVLRRIDGCLYAVKHSIKQLHQDRERRKALMEVQCLAALGSHENIVGYYSSWFENEQLYIQMELCDHSLSINRSSQVFSDREILEALYQIAKALQFIHEKGIVHLDVKPDNIYVKNGVYKLGDFGCSTLRDKSLTIEEGDARYMPQEILNERYDHLDKADIFSLGVAIYELIRGSSLPESGPQLLNIKEGKLPLLPGHSIQFQNLLKVMVDPDPVRRPSAKDLVENPIFGRPPTVNGNGLLFQQYLSLNYMRHNFPPAWCKFSKCVAISGWLYSKTRAATRGVDYSSFSITRITGRSRPWQYTVSFFV
ncbi:Serine/threonine protein kinase [Trema orientale]|uniref:Wee1-like protein kinase n=1 Tax=Trema orientale TaxID=63057 RepID=A0A2P5FFR2_TREOI|nr:Serine/threonine protein kinase [Trema orientale]